MRAAEVEHFAGMLDLELGSVRIHVHAAHWVNSGFGLLGLHHPRSCLCFHRALPVNAGIARLLDTRGRRVDCCIFGWDEGWDERKK